MNAQVIYKELMVAPETTHHLVLAKLFSLVFGRRVRSKEWGHLRKLINIYGAEVVYWAILNSAKIDGSGAPLVYVSKVCTGLLQNETKESKSELSLKTPALVQEMLEYESPNWDEILGGEDESC